MLLSAAKRKTSPIPLLLQNPKQGNHIMPDHIAPVNQKEILDESTFFKSAPHKKFQKEIRFTATQIASLAYSVDIC